MRETLSIHLQPNGGRFDCQPGQSVLEAALAAGYWLPHSCQQGECGACALRCTSGEHRELRRGSAQIGADEVLTCCIAPLTDLALEAPGVPAEAGARVTKGLASVVAVDRVSPDVARVRLQVRADPPLLFKAGQYAQVILRDGSRRSYSMANECDGTGMLEWHIRHMPNGRFSGHAYSKLKAGDTLRVEGPYGNFVLHEGDAPVILLASGTGYAPIAALLAAHGHELARRRAVLYWGGNRRADLYDVRDTAEWESRHPGIGIVPVLSAEEGQWTGRRGFVHQAVLQDCPSLAQCEVYACGNPLMIDAAKREFQAAGLPADRFHCDAFVVQAPQTKSQ